MTQEDTHQVNVIAYNFQGYDGYFVVHQYHTDNQKINQLRNGCKVLEVKHDSLRFIDSLSFFQMPLSAFPKTFGLTELKKGYFPHKFNIPENQEYVGPIPAQDYYMPETMSPKARQEFETWHQEQRHNDFVFDFQKELVAYCESDVHLLKEGCLTFKRLFEEKTGFNPFEHVTIASACNRDLHMNRMIPNRITSEPVGGWGNHINQSQGALEWLTWHDHQLRQKALDQLSDEDLQARDMMARAYPDHPHPSHRHYIQHVGNAGEYHVPGTTFNVDGFCQETNTNTIYEFHGCFWHGCPKCFPVRDEPRLRLCNRTMNDVYQKTQQKMEQLRAKGYRIEKMWQCEWDQLKQTRSDVQAYVASLQFVDLSTPVTPSVGDAPMLPNAIIV